MLKYLWGELLAGLREMLFGVYVCTMREELQEQNMHVVEQKVIQK